MSDPFHELRLQERFADALRAVATELNLELIGEGDLNAPWAASWRRHIVGRRCLVLECARSLRNTPDVALSTVRDFRHADGVSWRVQEAPPLLDARLETIAAAFSQDLAADFVERLRRVIGDNARCWNLQLLSELKAASQNLQTEPAFAARLPNARFRQAFSSLASEFGLLHPGLLFVGETIAWLWENSPDLPADRRVQTWVLLANKNADYPDGLVGRLRLERIPDGCGALYPDPLSTGYLRTARSFQHGIQHSWLETMGQSVVPCDFDVRWSLEVIDPRDGLPVEAELSGRSAEAAFACGLKALLNGEDLDQHVAVTAKFAEPGTGHGRLSRVGAINHKLLAAELRLKQIHEIVVADDQPEVTEDGTAQPQAKKLGETQLIPAGTLSTVYEQLARWPRLTRHANKQLEAHAQAVLDARCDPYIVPSLSRDLSERELPPTADAADRRQPLTDDEINSLTHGRLPRDRNRVRIFAGSGMGKSMFLVHCEQQIANANDGRLPLRVDRLSEYDWKADPDQVIASLAKKALAPRDLPRGGLMSIAPTAEDQVKCEPHEWCEWLQRLFRQGRVVLLLDALDQTRDHLDGLATFLESADVRSCPVLLTGRPETLQTRSGVFGGMMWETIQVDPFDKTRQREFLGPLAGRLLITIPSFAERRIARDDEKSEASSSNERKQQWADLLEVPLLLHMLRDLARRNKLDGMPNREAVYERAVTHLITQGWQTLQQSERADDLLDEAEVRELLANIGWQMISNGNFTAVLEGRPFRDVRNKHRGFLRALQQVDVTTLQSVLDRPGELGLAWRHLSFCEFFAGCRLAELDRSEQSAVAQEHARDPQWQWVFRFALSRAARDMGTFHTGTELALDLIRYGNPFLVYEAIDRDGLALLERWDQLCRWLVHRDWSNARDYRDAWDRSQIPPAADSSTLDLLSDLFRREFRNSRCLEPAWELLSESREADAEAIRTTFLSEFTAICGDPDSPGHEIATKLRNSFVRCPADSAIDRQPFWMGSPEGVGENSEHPRHLVVVAPFRMQQTQVTNEQFELFDPSHRDHSDDSGPDDDTPATYVNWLMAKMFCLWLGEGFRLPTEAEWEYACWAGNGDKKFFADSELQLIEYAWNENNSDGRTHPVGQLQKNAWDLYDMYGNVREWCQDWFAEDYYASLPIEASTVNPIGPTVGSSRVLRGGLWRLCVDCCPSAFRFHGEPEHRLDNSGFRVVSCCR